MPSPHLLPSDRRLRPSDDVITCAGAFLTPITPILQNGCIPVFLGNVQISGQGEAFHCTVQQMLQNPVGSMCSEATISLA
jgi:hypothetical protein